MKKLIFTLILVVTFLSCSSDDDSNSNNANGINVDGINYTITDANFYANVTHPNIGQFNLLIRAPWQATLNTAIWYNNITCTGANLDKWFDTVGSPVNCATTNGAPSFTPFSVTNINGYNGNNSAGSWLIYFKDVHFSTLAVQKI